MHEKNATENGSGGSLIRLFFSCLFVQYLHLPVTFLSCSSFPKHTPLHIFFSFIPENPKDVHLKILHSWVFLIVVPFSPNVVSICLLFLSSNAIMYEAFSCKPVWIIPLKFLILFSVRFFCLKMYSPTKSSPQRELLMELLIRLINSVFQMEKSSRVIGFIKAVCKVNRQGEI